MEDVRRDRGRHGGTERCNALPGNPSTGDGAGALCDQIRWMDDRLRYRVAGETR